MYKGKNKCEFAAQWQSAVSSNIPKTSILGELKPQAVHRCEGECDLAQSLFVFWFLKAKLCHRYTLTNCSSFDV